ncbi:MAG: zinc-ribbon domain containing protein [Deltaproteobacteria bacterium]|jgi:hypothetical protein
MKDKIITCIQCGTEFVITAAEQIRLAARGFDRPRRCPECRKKKEKGLQANPRPKDKRNKKRGWQRGDEEFFVG